MKQYKNTNYYITEDGRVYSTVTNKYLKLNNAQRYLQVSLGKRNTSQVHRLVAECYCENPNGYKEVNHIDGNKTNNHYTNLEWCSRSQNAQHAYDNGLISYNKGEDCYQAILKENEIIEMRDLFDSGIMSCKELAEKYNRPYMTIYYVIKRKSWKHVK